MLCSSHVTVRPALHCYTARHAPTHPSTTYLDGGRGGRADDDAVDDGARLLVLRPYHGPQEALCLPHRERPCRIARHQALTVRRPLQGRDAGRVALALLAASERDRGTSGLRKGWWGATMGVCNGAALGSVRRGLRTHCCRRSPSDHSATPPSDQATARSLPRGHQASAAQGCMVVLVMGASFPGSSGWQSCGKMRWGIHEVLGPKRKQRGRSAGAARRPCRSAWRDLRSKSTRGGRGVRWSSSPVYRGPRLRPGGRPRRSLGPPSPPGGPGRAGAARRAHSGRRWTWRGPARKVPGVTSLRTAPGLLRVTWARRGSQLCSENMFKCPDASRQIRCPLPQYAAVHCILLCLAGHALDGAPLSQAQQCHRGLPPKVPVANVTPGQSTLQCDAAGSAQRSRRAPRVLPRAAARC